MPRLAAFLFKQADFFDVHAAINGLAHVVDRKQSCRDCYQSFHFYPSAAPGFGSNDALDGVTLSVEAEFDADAGQRQGVCKGDQLRSVLGTLNRGNPRHTQDVTLACFARSYHGERGRLHRDPATRDSDTVRYVFGADIDHMGIAAAVKMG